MMSITLPTWTEDQKLLADDREVADWFGYSTAISGRSVIVGSPAHDALGTGISWPGAAYIFVQENGVWTQQQMLFADDGADGDYFGATVDIDGDTAVVGASLHDYLGIFAGAAYVFVRQDGVWTQQQKLVPSAPAVNGYFGSAVSIHGDTLVVSAPNENSGAVVQAGSVYVFTRDNGIWTEQQRLTTSDGAANDRLGDTCHSLSVKEDVIAVGASQDDNAGGADAGAVYVFTRSSGVWSEQQKLLASDGFTNDYFGRSVKLHGDTIVAGAHFDDDKGSESGSAYVFVLSSGVWSEQAKLTASDGAAGDHFGWSVAIHGDFVLVGAVNDDDAGVSSGSAYFYLRTSDGNWTEKEKLIASDAAAGDLYGESVALGGGFGAVGARQATVAAIDSGAVYMLEEPEIPRIDWRGGTIINLSGVFDSGDLHAYLGATGDFTDGSCYSGVAGQGYICRSLDGVSLSVVSPRLDALGVMILSLYSAAGIATTVIIVVEGCFSDGLFEMRTRWPDRYEVGPRRMELEPDQ